MKFDYIKFCYAMGILIIIACIHFEDVLLIWFMSGIFLIIAGCLYKEKSNE